MPLRTRQALGSVIVVILLLLALGIWQVVNSLSYAEPFGYGAGGVSIVVGAFAMGGLVVLLLILLVVWKRTGEQTDTEQPIKITQPSLRKHWTIVLTCGWVGTFWAIIGIARGWHGIDILLGAAILVLACIAALRIVRELGVGSS